MVIMNKLEKFVPSKSFCVEMMGIPALKKLLSDTLYIWGAAGVQFRGGSEIAISAPTL